MKKIFLLFTLVVTSLLSFAQVGIGTDTPDSKSVLEIVSSDNNKGILIPRMTEIQRDAISPTDAQNSLLVYNTDEDCYNYYSKTDKEWKSLCGQLGKAQFTFDCDQVKVNGVYIEGKELGSSHYLSITVNVTKPGNYTIIGETTNGYGFFGTGTFLSTGIQTVLVPAQGIPVNVQLDQVLLNANGEDKDCSASPVEVNVLTAAGSYSMSCANAVVRGVYKAGVAVNPTTDYIEIPVTVTKAGSWSISTNTVEGLSFSGSGVFSAPGTFSVKLYASGTPLSTTPKDLTLTNNSADGLNISCQVRVTVVIPKKRLLAIGLGTTYGYNISNNRPSGMLIREARNFGSLEESVFKYEGWDQIIDGGNGPSIADWNTYLLGSNPVDIVVIGYSWDMSAAHALSMVQYLIKGGVVVMFTEGAVGNQRTMRTLFNDESLSQSTAGGTGDGRTYNLPLTNDPALNGPFGDIRGKRWGDDATDAVYFTGLPTSDIFTYSNAMNANNNTGLVVGSVTGFRHLTFNYIWMGEGGFTSQSGTDLTSGIICPFMIDANNKPIPKTTYGDGTPIYNSTFFANTIAWAIQQAEFKGINTPK